MSENDRDRAMRRRRAWLAVTAWLVVIWTTVPFVRRLRDAYAAIAPAALVPSPSRRPSGINERE